MKNRVTIKAEARELVRTGRFSPVLVSAIVLVIVNVLGEVATLMEYGMPSIMQLRYLIEDGDFSAVLENAPANTPMITFLSVLVSLVTTVLYAGYFSYCMGIRRREETQISALLDGLGIVGKVIWCDILIGIKIFL